MSGDETGVEYGESDGVSGSAVAESEAKTEEEAEADSEKATEGDTEAGDATGAGDVAVDSKSVCSWSVCLSDPHTERTVTLPEYGLVSPLCPPNCPLLSECALVLLALL